MLGALTGDTIGSVYEFHNTKEYDFPLFDERSNYTDDSVMTMAVAWWLLTDKEHTFQKLENAMVAFGKNCPCPMGGYGGGFHKWLFFPKALNNPFGDAPYESSTGRKPYGSWGNGSAMRVSAVGWFFDTLEETERIAKMSAEITHNHPEGIKGAQATAAAIFLARTGKTKEKIREYIENTYGYDLHKSWEDWHWVYYWQSSCQGTVPQAIIAFLDSTGFEDAIRKAVSLGGDSDTLACITGAIAEAFYGGVPDLIAQKVTHNLPKVFYQIIDGMKEETAYGVLKPSNNYDLERFLKAQVYDYDTALRELRAGQKQSHWIWYIFPQMKGLGHSYNANYYGISGREEAKAYLEHETLGARLREATETILSIEGKSIQEIMPGIDALKFKSSMTLFDLVSPGDIFAQVIDRFFSGSRDMKTVRMLSE